MKRRDLCFDRLKDLITCVHNMFLCDNVRSSTQPGRWIGGVAASKAVLDKEALDEIIGCPAPRDSTSEIWILETRKSPDNAEYSKVESLEVKIPKSDCLSVYRSRLID
ncbi:hypothetical protein PMIN06_013061 [Paraphaeosphaeria minitans]